jgi:hypothetical protein
VSCRDHAAWLGWRGVTRLGVAAALLSHRSMRRRSLSRTGTSDRALAGLSHQPSSTTSATVGEP